jgi:hypothetical protein
MKTRVKDVPGGFSFQYTRAKHPAPTDWRFPRCDGISIIVWPSAAVRDRARSCFTFRRSEQAAMADLQYFGLIHAGAVAKGRSRG